jgi:hypothetical protein
MSRLGTLIAIPSILTLASVSASEETGDTGEQPCPAQESKNGSLAT